MHQLPVSRVRFRQSRAEKNKIQAFQNRAALFVLYAGSTARLIFISQSEKGIQDAVGRFLFGEQGKLGYSGCGNQSQQVGVYTETGSGLF